MQRINGTPFMRQTCSPTPHKQPQVNVMDLCFRIKDIINIFKHEISPCIAFQCYEPHKYLNFIFYLFFWQFFHFFLTVATTILIQGIQEDHGGPISLT